MDKIQAIINRLAPFVEDPNDGYFERDLLFAQGEYLEAFVSGRVFPPFEVEIQLSSKCNLSCSWCVGAAVQDRRTHTLLLPNSIDQSNVLELVRGLIDCEIGGLRIKTVKFAGFTGEPLMNKATALAAMQSLTVAERQVGLFTNGVLMDESTWDILKSITYVYVSLDAGQKTYRSLKGGPPNAFNRIIDNIRGLDHKRRTQPASQRTQIHVGYVVVPDNIHEISYVVQEVQAAGADLFTLKCDITGQYDLQRTRYLDQTFKIIRNLYRDYNDPPHFQIFTLHSRQDILTGNYHAWSCRNGCHYRKFLGTVASDGHIYFCDYNTLRTGVAMGSAMAGQFQQTWLNIYGEPSTSTPRFQCISYFCPPYANRVNFFLAEICKMVEEYDVQSVLGALAELRVRLSARGTVAPAGSEEPPAAVRDLANASTASGL